MNCLRKFVLTPKPVHKKGKDECKIDVFDGNEGLLAIKGSSIFYIFLGEPGSRSLNGREIGYKVSIPTGGDKELSYVGDIF